LIVQLMSSVLEEEEALEEKEGRIDVTVRLI
jgi:hypothetical protein